MSEWLKKHVITAIINGVILVIVSIIGWSTNELLHKVDKKADIKYIDQKIELVRKDIQINSNSIESSYNLIKKEIEDRISRNKEDRKLYLDEIIMIRKQLQLKADKKYINLVQ